MFREATALRLISEAQSMLAGTRSGGEVRAFQQTACGATTGANADDGPLLNALVKMVNLLKIIETPPGVQRGVQPRRHAHRLRQ